MAGLFVAFEGGEGAGKSTALAAVAEALRGDEVPVVTCREPGGTPAGEEVRKLLHIEMTPWAETFAFLVARAELVARVIQPALLRGDVVLCDRFEASTFAYQGFARGLNISSLRTANAIATRGISPDLTILLDIDPAVGVRRKAGEEEAIRTGLEELEFHQKVRDGYHIQAKGEKAKWRILDAAQPADEVARQAVKIVTDALYRQPRPLR